MKFHITIKDNETGKILHDEDTSAIIGGYANEEGSMSMIMGRCNEIDLAKTVYAAERAVQEVKDSKSPLFSALVAMIAGSKPEEVYLHNESNEDPADEEDGEE